MNIFVTDENPLGKLIARVGNRNKMKTLAQFCTGLKKIDVKVSRNGQPAKKSSNIIRKYLLIREALASI